MTNYSRKFVAKSGLLLIDFLVLAPRTPPYWIACSRDRCTAVLRLPLKLRASGAGARKKWASLSQRSPQDGIKNVIATDYTAW